MGTEEASEAGVLTPCLVHDPLLLPLEEEGRRKAECLWLCPCPLGVHSDQGSPGLAHGNSDPFLGALATPGGFLCNALQAAQGL